MLSINLVAVLLAAIAAFIIGFLFHGPLFGKLWMKLANIHPTGNEKFSDMVPQMVWNFVANIVAAYSIAVLYSFTSGSSYITELGSCGAIVVAVWAWLGFIVWSSSMGVIWMKQSSKLWIFECVATLVSVIAMGAIIGNW